MTILLASLQAFQAETANDTTANGGRRGTVEIVSGAAQNVFPYVFRADRIAGLLRYRKLFYINNDDTDQTLYNAAPFFHIPPDGDHYLWWHVGTFDDTQADITGTERRYGAAKISTAATATSSTVVVTVKNADQTSMFADGDPIMISGKLTPDSTTGAEEQNTISGAPVVSGLEVTITTATALANDYAIGAVVSSGKAAADIACTITGWVETWSGTGAYDEGSYPVITNNIGTVYDTWTLTFSDATNFTVSGAVEGNVGAGTTAADFAPLNAARSNNPFFALEAAGFSGTPAAGDTIVWTTNPAELPIWETLTIPALATPLGNAGLYSYLDAETI